MNFSQPSVWISPWKNKRVIARSGCEVTPFLFKDRLYRLENFKRSEDFPGQPIQYRFHEDGFRIRDVEADRMISIPLLNHYFASAFVAEGRVFVFCGDFEIDRPWWHIRHVVMIESDDLVTWSKPSVVLRSEDRGENLFNTAVCWDGRRYIMLFETDDCAWPKFTFKFCESDDLRTWRRISGALFGTDKYVGGPALYFEGGYYYVTYAHQMGGGRYETRIARSRDLRAWEEAPEDRPFMTFDPTHRTDPEYFPEVLECNASDVELCEWQGKVLVFWNGGDQLTCGDLKTAEFDGSLAQLLEGFFSGVGGRP